MKNNQSFYDFLLDFRNKTLFVMKSLTVFLVLFSLYSFSNSYSQSKKLKIEIKEATLMNMIESIENQSEFVFIYNDEVLPELLKALGNIQIRNKSIYKVLDRVVNKEKLIYSVNERQVILNKKEEIVGSNLQQQISGKVTDSDGLPLPGVNIIIEGTSRGVQTDFNGVYSINASEGEILKVSFVGMQTQFITVGSSNAIDIVMVEDLEDLDAVIVTGYQKIERKLFTGSAATVKLEDVKLDGVPDISRSLQGQVAGVEIQNVSGTFGTAPVIRIRGNASINGTNKPLWVIDGVILEDAVEISIEDISSGNLDTVLSSSTAGINPEDVETFQVLKDASATALYGARALNGVIVITTKRGKTGKPSISFTSSLTTRVKPNYDQFNFLNSGEEMSVYQELYEKGWIDIAGSNGAANHGVFSDMFKRIVDGNVSWGPGGSPNYNYLQRYANANTDWFDVLFKDSFVRTNSLSISSGTETSRYRASVSSIVDEGQTIADDVKNYTANLNADFDLSDRFTIGFKVTGNIRDQRIAASEDRDYNALTGVFERNFDINPFNYALYTSRSITPYDENGNRQFFRRSYAPFNILHEVRT